MSVFITFTAIMWFITYFGITALRWFALEFIYDEMNVMWSGVAFNIEIGSLLLLVASIVGFFFAKPFDKVLSKLKAENRTATKDEIAICLRSYRKLILLVWAANFLGFFIGQIIVIYLKIADGTNLFIPSRVFFVMAQAVGFGGISGITTIKLIDFMLTSKRERLGIRSIMEFKKFRTSNISTSIGLVFFIAVYFIAINMFSVPYGIIIEQRAGVFKGDFLTLFMKKGALCFFCSIGFGAVAFVTVLHGLSVRIKTTSKLLDDIANNGDLTARIHISMTDDFGVLISCINTMIEKLSSMIRDFKSSTDVVNQSVGRLSTTARSASKYLQALSTTLAKLDSNTRRQDKLVYLTGSDISALSGGINNIKKNIEAKDYEQAIKESEKSIQDLYKLRESMQTIVTASSTTVQTVNEGLLIVEDMKKTVLLVDSSASGNKNTVDKIHDHVNQFNIQD